MFKYILLMSLVFIGILYPKVYFIEHNFDNNKISFVQIDHKQIMKYPIEADIILGYDFQNENSVIINLFSGEEQKLISLNLLDKSTEVIYNSNQEYISGFAVIDSMNIILAKCGNEILRLEEDELFRFNIEERKIQKIEIDERLNFEYLEVAEDKMHLSFLHVGEMKENDTYSKYLMVFDFKNNLFLADSIHVDKGEHFLISENSKFTQWISKDEILYKKYSLDNPKGKIFKINIESGVKEECKMKLNSQIKDFYFKNMHFYVVTKENKVVKYEDGSVKCIYLPNKNERVGLDNITVL